MVDFTGTQLRITEFQIMIGYSSFGNGEVYADTITEQMHWNRR